MIRQVHPTPNVAKGVEYWEGVPATVDGVLGGYGNGTLPRIDAMGSRVFLLRTLPHLSATPPAAYNGSPRSWIQARLQQRGGKGKTVTRALDCGAGVGRVTADVLLPLVDEVHLVEPVAKFLHEAKRCSSTWAPMKNSEDNSPFYAQKAVHFHISTLQDFDVADPSSCSSTKESIPPTYMEKPVLLPPAPLIYDIILCQWCLQHLSESDLVSFLRASKKVLRPPLHADEESMGWTGGVIFVKENVCRDPEDGTEATWYDDEDYSVTRSRRVYERLFQEAGLTIVRTEVQLGFPSELFPVHMCVL